jgi:hypothetical protein
MSTVQVRYIVHDVDAAMLCYRRHLGFEMVMHPAPSFAMLSRGDLRLVLSAPNPSAGGGKAMPDGSKQEPGGGHCLVHDSHRTVPQPSKSRAAYLAPARSFHNDERKA